MSTATATVKKPSKKGLQQTVDRLFDLQGENRLNMRKTSASERIARLRRLREALLDTKEELYQALHKDFRKPKEEVDLTEIVPTIMEIREFEGNLKKWMGHKTVKTPIVLGAARSEVHFEPKGRVLIIGPWNYPFQLTILPLINAIGAGNTAVLKPSEYTPNTSAYMAKLVSQVFPENEVAVVEGDHTAAQALLEKPFDHIFFTGSPNIGKIVMGAAAKHLASVTLELGGKCPVIIDDSANLADAAKKIAWGKFVNNGQTCLAPDYILVPRKLQKEFVGQMRDHIRQFYGPTPDSWAKSPDYARIVNEKNHKRLQSLLTDAQKNGAKIEDGGIVRAEENYISPTLLSDIDLDSEIMQEEIFGPLLPIVPFDSLDEALTIINGKHKPLALYVFSEDKQVTDRVLRETSAGGTCVNDVVIHFVNPYLPFGGVNNSGIGSYHGEYGFKTFSHERAVLKQFKYFSTMQMLYPPYGRIKDVVNFFVKLFS